MYLLTDRCNDRGGTQDNWLAETERTFIFAPQTRIQNEHMLGYSTIKLLINENGIQETGYVC